MQQNTAATAITFLSYQTTVEDVSGDYPRHGPSLKGSCEMQSYRRGTGGVTQRAGSGGSRGRFSGGVPWTVPGDGVREGPGRLLAGLGAILGGPRSACGRLGKCWVALLGCLC